MKVPGLPPNPPAPALSGPVQCSGVSWSSVPLPSGMSMSIHRCLHKWAAWTAAWLGKPGLLLAWARSQCSLQAPCLQACHQYPPPLRISSTGMMLSYAGPGEHPAQGQLCGRQGCCRRRGCGASPQRGAFMPAPALSVVEPAGQTVKMPCDPEPVHHRPSGKACHERAGVGGSACQVLTVAPAPSGEAVPEGLASTSWVQADTAPIASRAVQHSAWHMEGHRLHADATA